MNGKDHTSCLQNLTEEDVGCNEDSVHNVLRTIQLPMSVIFLMLTTTINASILFGLRRANKTIFTAVLLSWMSINDIALSVLYHVPVLINIIVRAKLLGDVMCSILGVLSTIFNIAQTILLTILSMIRYLAVIRPCVRRESSLFHAAKMAVLSALVIAVCAAGVPFLSYPNYGYIDVLWRSDMIGSWASHATTVIFIVIPSLISCCLAGITIWTIRVRRWLNLGWSHQASGFKKPKMSIRPALQEIRASRGLAAVLLVSGIIPLGCYLLRVIAAALSPFANAILVSIYANANYICPVLRSCLILTTSPVLRKVLINWLLSAPDKPSESTPKPSNFKLIQQGFMPPTPPLHLGYPIFTRKHRMRIQVQDDSLDDGGPSSPTCHAERRPSNISTITCEVFCERDKEDCIISISGDCEVTSLGESLNKQKSGSADSMIVCIRSSFGDHNKLTASACSLSDCSVETILSSNFSKSKSASCKKKWGQGGQAHRQSTVSLNSLSPNDACYNKGFDRKPLNTNACNNPDHKMTFKRSRMSIPVTVFTTTPADGSTIPPNPRIAFSIDSEKKNENAEEEEAGVKDDDKQ